MKSSTFGIFITAFLMTALADPAAADDAELLQQFKDRQEIEALMWRYTRALDTGDADAYAATYTEDGQFGTGANATKGRAALKAMIEGIGQGQSGSTPNPQMYHMTANHYLEFVDENTARLHAYYITDVAASGDAPPRLAAVGRSVDTLVRTSDGWRIQIRDVAPQD